jgi:O-antigen/teichoic acid export membrane protein
LSQVFGYIQKNSDYWVVSGLMGGSVLGAYYVSYVLPSIVVQRLSYALRQVMLPVYAATHGLEDSARHWRRLVPSVVGLGLPLLAFVAATSDLLVQSFFGSQWLESVTPMRLLSLSAVLELFMTTVATVAIIHGLTRRYLAVQAIRALTTAALAFWAASLWPHPTAVAAAVLVATVVAFAFQEFALARPLGVSVRSVARDVLGYCVLTGTMVGAVVGLLALLPDAPSLLLLLVAGIVGVATYAGAGLLFAPNLISTTVTDVRRLIVGS